MDWNELAQKISYDTIPESEEPQDMFPGFSVWNWGTGRFSKTLGGMKSKIKEGQVALIDYEYEHSRNMRAPATAGMQRGLSLCFLQHPALDLPEIFQRNEAPIQKMFKRVAGKHDIYFSEDPEFSERFEIQGPEAEVHQIYRPEVRSYFIRHFEYSPLRLEAKGDTVLIHFGMMIQPEDSRILLYRISEIASFWANRKIEFEVPPEFFFKS